MSWKGLNTSKMDDFLKEMYMYKTHIYIYVYTYMFCIYIYDMYIPIYIYVCIYMYSWKREGERDIGALVFVLPKRIPSLPCDWTESYRNLLHVCPPYPIEEPPVDLCGSMMLRVLWISWCTSNIVLQFHPMISKLDDFSTSRLIGSISSRQGLLKLQNSTTRLSVPW